MCRSTFWTKVQPVLQLANEAIGNRETAQRLAQWSHRGEEGWTYAPMQDSKAAMEKAVHGLRDGIKREMENSDRAQLEWENSGLQDAIDEWLLDVNDNQGTGDRSAAGEDRERKAVHPGG